MTLLREVPEFIAAVETTRRVRAFSNAYSVIIDTGTELHIVGVESHEAALKLFELIFLCSDVESVRAVDTMHVLQSEIMDGKQPAVSYAPLYKPPIDPPSVQRRFEVQLEATIHDTQIVDAATPHEAVAIATKRSTAQSVTQMRPVAVDEVVDGEPAEGWTVNGKCEGCETVLLDGEFYGMDPDGDLMFCRQCLSQMENES